MNVHAWIRDGKPQLTPAPARRRWWRFLERHLTNISLALMVLLLVAFVLYPHVVVTVPSGQVGVLWKRFAGGTVLDPRALKDEGLHIVLPWDKVFLYDLRVQSLTENYNAISSDGVSLTAAMNIRFRLKRDSIPTLHQVVGPSYIKLIGPGIASQMREVVAQFTAEQVYSTARQEIQDKIRERTVEKLGDKMMEREGEVSYSVAMRDTVTLYDTLLFGIELPDAIVTAINRKTEQYYISEEYKFRVEREKRESERKRIEAEGIRDFQQIVTQNGIADSYLRWRGIEATLQLSQSNNAKVVVIGSAKDGLPIILGNADAPAPAKPAQEPEGSGGKVRATAARPAMEADRTPAAGLTTPHEQMPFDSKAKTGSKADSGDAAPAQGKAAPGAAAPSADDSNEAWRVFSWPPRWSELDNVLTWKLWPKEPAAEGVGKPR
jgi:regulator of protease activity HflC (stomatin/prohibitin superfamily)